MTNAKSPEFENDSHVESRFDLSDKKADILIQMINKAYNSCQSASKSLETITFRYIALLLAVILALISNGIVLSGILEKMSGILGIVFFLSFATNGLYMKNKQYLKLYKVLIHLEDLVGCYTPGYYVKGSTLLPPEWLKNPDSYIGSKVNKFRFVMLWCIGILVCCIIWFNKSI